MVIAYKDLQKRGNSILSEYLASMIKKSKNDLDAFKL